MGNGFTGVALSGPPEALVFHLARNDFWRLRSAHDETWPLVLGLVKLMVPKLEGASYQIDQSLYDATTIGHFSREGQRLSLEAYLAATEDLLVINLKSEGSEAVKGSLALELPEPDTRFTDNRDSGSQRCGLQTPPGNKKESREMVEGLLEQVVCEYPGSRN